MLGATHVDVVQTILEAVRWKGDVKLAARNAAYPDSVRSIEVDGLGVHAIGFNLAALVHFCRPYGNGSFGGYSWPSDRSVPHLDLSKRKVISHPEAWGFPMIESFILRDPLSELIRDLTTPGHMGSIEADRITFPTASVMADWFFQLYCLWVRDSGSARRQEALDILCGWMAHFVADAVVPHHADGILLDGHSAFEGDVDECWRKMKSKGTVDSILGTMVKTTVPETLTVRGLIEERASLAAISPWKLGWYRCFWRPGWNRLVKKCVLQGIAGSYQLARILQREADRNPIS